MLGRFDKDCAEPRVPMYYSTQATWFARLDPFPLLISHFLAVVPHNPHPSPSHFPPKRPGQVLAAEPVMFPAQANPIRLLRDAVGLAAQVEAAEAHGM